MQIAERGKVQNRIANRAGIWLAFSFALGLHLVLLLVPLAYQKPPLQETSQSKLELQLSISQPQVVPPPAPLPEPDKPLPEPDKPLPETVPFEPGQPEVVHEEHTGPLPAMTESPVDHIAKNLPPDLDNMNEPEKTQLTNTILARQFLSEESAANQLFGKPMVRDSSELQRDFHYPVRQDMLTMLDQPLPDLPFAYTPDLVHFAYEPGVKGDLQRFWDSITPEFGWRTRYGTEVRCKLILVIAGCAWK